MTSRDSWMKSQRFWGTHLPIEVAAVMGCAVPALLHAAVHFRATHLVLALTKEHLLIQTNLWVCYQLILGVGGGGTSLMWI